MGAGAEFEVVVPDIGDFDSVDVIEILVKPGDEVAAEDPLITLESDKATMDIPAPQAGRVSAVLVKLGDKIGQGAPIVKLEQADGGDAAAAGEAAPDAAAEPAPAPKAAAGRKDAPEPEPEQEPDPEAGSSPEFEPEPPAAKSPADEERPGVERAVQAQRERTPAAAPSRPFHVPDAPGAETPPPPPPTLLPGSSVYASPGMRRFARELGVDLEAVQGSGAKGRILREDIAGYVKQTLAHGGRGGLPEAPVVDFAKYGEIETRPLSRIKRATGANLLRAWTTIPHVTQFDEADITELEAFRRARLEETKAEGVKLTLVAFVLKAVTDALARFPEFNASLTPDGESLVYKKYTHIGVAVNTDRGLLVPVMRDVDRRGIHDIARELAELSQRARDGKLAPGDMQGGCFTVTSLGGVGGTGFAPIINPPELAILGVSPAAMKPVYRNGGLEPRLMLPISLSYDHRVIDGVAGARFTRHVCTVLGDLRHALL